jgi:hypothetical protein
VIWADKKFQLGHGRAFAIYAMAYTVGRFWIEALRIDESQMFFGLRLNDWTSIVVFVGALAYFLLQRGPRERLRAVDGGKVEVVTDGEPQETVSLAKEEESKEESTEPDSKPEESVERA